MEDVANNQLREFMLREIAIVQEIIRRVTARSFLIKGWTVALVVVAMMVVQSERHLLICLVPLFAFWFLDSYYVWQERLYWKLHEWIASHRLQSYDHLFDMNVHVFKEEVPSLPRTMFSIRGGWFYLSILLFVGVYVVMATLP
jgi:hypothetical protein